MMCTLKQRIFVLLILSVFIIMGTTTANAQENPEIGYIGPSYDGLRVFDSKDVSKSGYMDEEGNIIVPCEYSSASNFVNGFGLVSKDNGISKTYSAVNTKGEIVLTFDPQLGNVGYYNGKDGFVIKYFDAATAGRFALINGEGKLITGYDYYSLIQESRPPVYGVLWAEKVFPESYNAKRGVIDWNGDIIIPFDYADISNTEENWGVLSVVKMVDGKPKYGYLYANGVEMLPCVYSRTEPFTNGCGAVEKDGKYAAINANAVFITQFIYDSIEPFHEGLAIVVKSATETAGRSLGMIDTNGQEVFPCKYFSLSQSVNGIVVAQESEGSPSIQLRNPLITSREINIYKNGVWIYTNQEAVIKNDRALAPLRGISESLGFTVDWNAQSQQITLQDNKRVIRLTIGSNEATLNFLDDGKEPETILLDAAPEIINGRTLVPVRFIAESTGADVSWDSVTQNINIT